MAITFDATSSINETASTHTWSHTCTGSNLILLVGGRNGNGDTVTGVTYNGVAMTQLSKGNMQSSDWSYLYYLLAPATGAHNVVVSKSGSGGGFFGGLSYAGVKQTGFPDASSYGTAGSQTQASATVTTIADGCWVMAWLDNEVDALNPDAGITERVSPSGSAGFFDNNKSNTPAGSVTISGTIANSGNGATYHGCVSLAPDAFTPPAGSTTDALQMAHIA